MGGGSFCVVTVLHALCSFLFHSFFSLFGSATFYGLVCTFTDICLSFPFCPGTHALNFSFLLLYFEF